MKRQITALMIWLAGCGAVCAWEQVVEVSSNIIISQSGTYILTANITGSSWWNYDFSIEADDVILDLNGFTFFGDNAKMAVLQSNGYQRLTVRNGFFISEAYDDGSSVAISALGTDNRIENITVLGYNNGFDLGARARIENCAFVEAGSAHKTYGFRCQESATIRNCIIQDVEGGMGSVGVEAGRASRVENITFIKNKSFTGTGILVNVGSVINDAVIAMNNAGFNDFTGISAAKSIGYRFVSYSNEMYSGSAFSGFKSIRDAVAYDLIENNGIGTIAAFSDIEQIEDAVAGPLTRAATNMNAATGFYGTSPSDSRILGSVAYIRSTSNTTGFGRFDRMKYCVAKRNSLGFEDIMNAQYCLADNNVRYGFFACNFVRNCHASDTSGGDGFALGSMTLQGSSATGNATNFNTSGSYSLYGEIFSNPGENFVEDVSWGNFEF